MHSLVGQQVRNGEEEGNVGRNKDHPRSDTGRNAETGFPAVQELSTMMKKAGQLCRIQQRDENAGGNRVSRRKTAVLNCPGDPRIFRSTYR